MKNKKQKMFKKKKCEDKIKFIALEKTKLLRFQFNTMCSSPKRKSKNKKKLKRNQEINNNKIHSLALSIIKKKVWFLFKYFFFVIVWTAQQINTLSSLFFYQLNVLRKNLYRRKKKSILFFQLNENFHSINHWESSLNSI